MSRRLSVYGAAALLFSGAASAADLPLPVEPIEQAVVPPEFSWSGFYVGIEGGGGFNDTSVSMSSSDPLFCTQAECSSSYDVDGFVVGGRAGFNWQNGWVVLGVEGDANYSDMNGAKSIDVVGIGPVNTTLTSDYNLLGTIRGRVGAAFGRVLVYGTGGLAFGQVKDTVTVTVPPPAIYNFAGSSDDLLFGWTAGGGVDVAFTDHIIIGAQALYFDLEDQDVAVVPFPANPFAGGDAVFEHTGILARGHVSYKW